MNSWNFNKDIYDNAIILKAFRDYSEVADIKLIESEQYYICKCVESKYDGKVTMMEFANYIIELQNKRGMLC